jgi:hypothetical protein
MAGLMDEGYPDSYGGEQEMMIPPRGVAVPQPQGVNPIQVLAQELQKTQAEVPPQMQPGVPQGQPAMPRQ